MKILSLLPGFRPLAGRTGLRLAQSLVLGLLLACSPDGQLNGAGKTGSAAVRKLEPLDPSFKFAAKGYGFDSADRLVLLGDEETIRWNPAQKSFERFGGKLQGGDGHFFRDGKGSLYLNTGTKIYGLAKDAATWSELAIDYPQPAPDLSVSPGSKGFIVDSSGTQYLLLELFSQRSEVKGVYRLYRKEPGDSGFREVFSFEKGSAPMKSIQDLRYDLQVRGDGSLFLRTAGGYFALAKGASEPKPIVDCSTQLGGVCSDLTLFTHPESDQAYLANTGFGPLIVYRIPAGKPFPLVPDKLTTYPGAITEARNIRYYVDKSGSFWGGLTVSDALSVDYPPYILDLTTVRKLEAANWNARVSFVEPSYPWTFSDHGSFYAFGQQAVPGGFWLGVDIYALTP